MARLANENLSNSQLRRALDATRELAELRQLAEYPERVASLLRTLIPADQAGYNAIELESRQAMIATDPVDSVFPGGPEELARLAHQNPIIVRALSGDARALRLSDFLTRRQLHRTELYHHVYRLIPQEYQLGMQLPSPWRGPARTADLIGVSLGRTRRDFTDAERRLLELLRPHLAATLERLHELALVHALRAVDGQSETGWLSLIDVNCNVAWATPAAVAALALTVGGPLPLPLAGWVKRERTRRWAWGPGASEPTHSDRTGSGADATTAIDGRRLRARLIPGAYPQLDALHLTQVPAVLDATAQRALGLTRRQADVLALAIEGRGAPEIASVLCLSPRTVEKHFERIYARLGVANRTQAILAVITAAPR